MEYVTQLTEAAGRVTKYVEAGYMVRVRSDYDTLEARANDPSRARTLLAAGAHFTSTDFPSLPTYFNSSYQVLLFSHPVSSFSCQVALFLPSSCHTRDYTVLEGQSWP